MNFEQFDVTGAVYGSQKRSDKLFFPHYTMTDSEYGVWNYARSVSHESKVFQCSARAMAARFRSMGKTTANRRINGLIKSGWFDIIEPAKRGKGGLWIPAKLRPLSPAEYQQRYSEVCKKAVDDVEKKLKLVDQCAVPAYSTGGTGDPVEDHPGSVESVRVPSPSDLVPPTGHPVPNQALTCPAGGTKIEYKTEIESEIKTKDNFEAKTGVSAGLSNVYFSTLEKPVLDSSENQQVQIRPPEAAAISRANVAAPQNVSDTQAQNGEGLLATSQAHVAAAAAPPGDGRIGMYVYEVAVPGEEGKYLRIGNIRPGGPAANAGLRKGDIIKRFDGKAIREQNDLLPIASLPTGAVARLCILRDDGSRFEEHELLLTISDCLIEKERKVAAS